MLRISPVYRSFQLPPVAPQARDNLVERIHSRNVAEVCEGQVGGRVG